MYKVYKNRDVFRNYLNRFPHTDQKWCKPDKKVKHPYIQPHLHIATDEFNTITQSCKAMNFVKIIRTEKGTIKKNRIIMTGGAYDIQVIQNSKNNVLKGFIITIILGRTIWILKYGYIAAKDSNMTGIKAFKEFSKIANEFNIDLEKYALDKELAIKEKEKIEKPMIINFKKHQELEHINHLDFNAAWPSSICDKFPELEPVYQKLSKDAKNCVNGFFQSKYIDYKYARLAKTGINGCNKRIKAMWNKLNDDNFEVCGINTDGIWYYDTLGQNRVYHDKDEGEGLHKWKNDYIDCKWFATSNGQYYFITPDGKFHAKARGYYTYEAIKPRDEWNKEDYFKAMFTMCNILYLDDQQLLICEKIGE